MKKLNGLLSCALTHLVAVILAVAIPVFAADPTATLAGRVDDPTGGVVPGTTVQATNVDTNVSYYGETNDVGAYRIPGLPPGHYRMIIEKPGFAKIVKPGVELHVQDVITVNFQMRVGSISESITVESGAQMVDTESAAVSTVVDRKFAENLPLNGRSFQSLIQLAPGVVLTANNGNDTGQFSVNGQRASSNYWMVDGVSANIGVSSGVTPGNGFGGALGSFSAQGGTNSLVSVDALQEFRIQTSTYAPEFGRTPGGQISIVTRSGTNQFHGTAFDYLRNDVFDANDWFADNAGLRKPEERQNDFGGTFSGKILKDRTFFFFSYEGLRLRLPRVGQTTVPDLLARTNALPAIQPFLNAYPLPNGPEDPAHPGAAQFNLSFSNKSTLDAYSLRLDHKLNSKLALFGRFNYSPSNILARGANNGALSTVTPSRITTQTTTAGATWVPSSKVANDLRFNYSRTSSEGSFYLDTFGGAVPLTALPLPNPYTLQDAQFVFGISSLDTTNFQILTGKNAHQLQRQFNIVDSLSVQRGTHSLKFGVDFRRLTPQFVPPQYQQAAQFLNVPSAEIGSTEFNQVIASRNGTLLFRNLGMFAQDTWRILPRLTLTYGLRWDVDFAPSSINGPSLAAAVNFTDPATLNLAPPGTPAFRTPYGNVAPRFGLAYQVSQSEKWQTVLRGGFGVFYDLVSSEAGNGIEFDFYPFGAKKFPSGTFPFADTAPPPITFAGSGWLAASYPHLQLPYTLEWNVALEQALGKQQTISVSYVGAAGRRLLQTEFLFFPNPNVQFADLTINGATSDYDALQVQFQRRLSRGLQVVSSYSWSHSIDTASAGSFGSTSNTAGPFNANANRGSSDFDIRSGFSAGVTYDVPSLKINAVADAVLRGWSVQNILQARSATPVDISDTNFFEFNGGFDANVRPDVVPGQPFYLHGSQYAGGKAFNPAAFQDPPTDPSTGFTPLRQGNLPRNFLRGFGATQWDLAIHREFPIRESLKLQFRAEIFNVLNHPNFGPPSGMFGRGGFGVSSAMLGQSLAGGNAGNGAFDPLYQIGGPRSIQLALKLTF